MWLGILLLLFLPLIYSTQPHIQRIFCGCCPVADSVLSLYFLMYGVVGGDMEDVPPQSSVLLLKQWKWVVFQRWMLGMCPHINGDGWWVCCGAVCTFFIPRSLCTSMQQTVLFKIIRDKTDTERFLKKETSTLNETSMRIKVTKCSPRGKEHREEKKGSVA